MSKKKGEISERERLRRQRQAEQQKGDHPDKPHVTPQQGHPGGHGFGLVPRHQKKTERGS